MKRVQVGLRCVLIAAAWVFATAAWSADPYVPVKWQKFVSVAGQAEPVPEQWLQDDEARSAHSLVLPDAVPKPVPYSFNAELLGDRRKQSIDYFNHLCKTEAGQWIFKTVQNVEGFYFARPQGAPTSDVMADLRGPEMPWIQRWYMLTSDRPRDQGWWFIQSPQHNYRFVEQPHRNVPWQSAIQEPFIRLFGYTRGYLVKPGQVVADWNEKTPMQVIGIPAITARYGYTWRGIKRAQDREHGIAGGELLIYDLTTREILAVRRQFLITLGNPRNADKAAWEVAAPCRLPAAYPAIGEFSQFAFEVLETIEPSTTGKK